MNKRNNYHKHDTITNDSDNLFNTDFSLHSMMLHWQMHNNEYHY